MLYLVFVAIVIIHMIANAYYRRGMLLPAFLLPMVSVALFFLISIVTFLFDYKGAPNGLMLVVISLVCLLSGKYWWGKLKTLR